MITECREIWFWQRIISPHMAGLASALARRGHKVVYVAEQLMSESRTQQGWKVPRLRGVKLEEAPDAEAMRKLAATAPGWSIHLCQGVRGNGPIRGAQEVLARKRLRQWTMMETVDDRGWRGPVKRLVYRTLFWSRRDDLEGVLATGRRTPRWVAARGAPRDRVFPFTYFLEPPRPGIVADRRDRDGFELIFVGQIVRRKRLDLLIRAVAAFGPAVHLTVVGDGPLGQDLRNLASRLLGQRVRWVGKVPIGQVPEEIMKADCLVLPSTFDGWGAVVSEALMVGTPAVCSDACGAAEAVLASGHGGVFRRGHLEGLKERLQRVRANGPLTLRTARALARWAKSLTSARGARYLEAILDHMDGEAPRPLPPWREAIEE